MKAYVTSIGEKTTKLCCQQLERFGFEVVLYSGLIPWPQKYKLFIEEAEGPCLRVDADVIINKNIKIPFALPTDQWPVMAQFHCYDFYRNNVGVAGPVYYTAEALEIIRANFGKLDFRRPEATAWRLPEINQRTFTSQTIVGMHGFFQTQEDFDRHLKNKQDRKQMEEYDFDLAKELMSL